MFTHEIFHQNLIFQSKCPFFVFYVVRTFRVVPVVKKGTMGGIFGKKIRKSIDSKDQIRLRFHEKKAKKLLKIPLLSLFLERIFYLCEDIVCTCDSLADPCSIETFENGIILVFEMIVCLNNPPSMKKFQMTQLEGYFNITRYNSIWQLFANSISIPCVELVWDKFLCWLIDGNIQRLELVCEIVWNDNQLTIILSTQSFNFFVVLTFEIIHNNEGALVFQVAKLLLFGGQIYKDNYFE